jgi:hypothetical protein
VVTTRFDGNNQTTLTFHKVPCGTSSLGHLSPCHWPKPRQHAQLVTMSTSILPCHLAQLVATSACLVNYHIIICTVPRHRSYSATSLSIQCHVIIRIMPHHHLYSSMSSFVQPRVTSVQCHIIFRTSTCHLHTVPHVNSVQCHVSLPYHANSSRKRQK